MEEENGRDEQQQAALALAHQLQEQLELQEQQTIPHDLLLAELLPRLPLEHLMRMRAMCRAWLEEIESSTFVHRPIDRPEAAPPLWLFCLSKAGRPFLQHPSATGTWRELSHTFPYLEYNDVEERVCVQEGRICLPAGKHMLVGGENSRNEEEVALWHPLRNILEWKVALPTMMLAASVVGYARGKIVAGVKNEQQNPLLYICTRPHMEQGGAIWSFLGECPAMSGVGLITLQSDTFVEFQGFLYCLVGSLYACTPSGLLCINMNLHSLQAIAASIITYPLPHDVQDATADLYIHHEIVPCDNSIFLIQDLIDSLHIYRFTPQLPHSWHLHTELQPPRNLFNWLIHPFDVTAINNLLFFRGLSDDVNSILIHNVHSPDQIFRYHVDAPPDSEGLTTWLPRY